MPAPRTTALPERNLDVLRAIAVLLVLADHVLTVWDVYPHPITRWDLGRMGVLLFFVHTSLVLMGSLERGGRRSSWIRAFYLRRAFRIYPLAIAAVLLAVLLGMPAGVASRGVAGRIPAPPVATLAANLTLTQNIVGKPDVLSVLWSLPLEVQMYVALPVCFLVGRRGVGAAAAALGGAALLGAGVRFSRLPGMWRLSVLAFAPCFLSGVLAYAMLAAGVRPRLPAWTWAFVLAACVPAFLLLAPDPGSPERGWLFCVAVGCAIPLVRNLGESRCTRIAKVVCTYSYGIYLLHEPVLRLSFAELRGAPLVLQWTVCLALLVGVPAAAYRLIERPGILLGTRLAARGQSGDAGVRIPHAGATPMLDEVS